MSSLRAALVFVPLSLTACTTLATGPSWVGGGLAVAVPEREAVEEKVEAKERAELAKQPNEIGAKHILVMHEKSTSKPDNVTRTREQAKKRAEECLQRIKLGESFEKLVKEYTDEPGGAERGGDLGVFDRAAMVKSFADAAFALKIGEVSTIVETQFGYHIIKRTE